jgi:hypothetical protein
MNAAATNLEQSELEWSMLSPEDFKKRVLALKDFPQEYRREILRFSIWFLNIKFGVVPDRMRSEAYQRLLELEEFKDYNIAPGPLLPFIQRSWDGGQVAGWLIRAKIVAESRRSIISENLNGRQIYEGQLSGILTDVEMNDAHRVLKEKISTLSKTVWDMSKSFPQLCPFISQTLDLEIERMPSVEEVHLVLKHRYYVRLQMVHIREESEFCMVENEPQPNSRDQP